MFGVASSKFGRIKGPGRADCIVVGASFKTVHKFQGTGHDLEAWSSSIGRKPGRPFRRDRSGDSALTPKVISTGCKLCVLRQKAPRK